MSRLLLALLLLSPSEAAQPSIDTLHAAYIGGGWRQIMHGREAMVCIAEVNSRHVDRVVQMIVDRAKGIRCS